MNIPSSALYHQAAGVAKTRFISLQVVIVVEGTQNTRFLLGIIIAVVVSNWLADLIHTEGVYESDLEADGSIIFLRPFPPKPLLPVNAGEVGSCMHAFACCFPVCPSAGRLSSAHMCCLDEATQMKHARADSRQVLYPHPPA